MYWLFRITFFILDVAVVCARLYEPPAERVQRLRSSDALLVDQCDSEVDKEMSGRCNSDSFWMLRRCMVGEVIYKQFSSW
jgi:hypothetical protein